MIVWIFKLFYGSFYVGRTLIVCVRRFSEKFIEVLLFGALIYKFGKALMSADVGVIFLFEVVLLFFFTAFRSLVIFSVKI